MKEWLVFTGAPELWIELAGEAYRFVRSKT
jgi:hypothetical protein